MIASISLRFAELLVSRLCHDLITPIGATNTGLELFQETAPEHHTESKEILNLILHSAQTASARVGFFRAAFGKSGDFLPFKDIKTLTENYLIRTKLTLHWGNSFQDESVPKEEGRIFLNSILWMSECAPRGGVIHITCPQDTTTVFSLLLKADPLIVHQGTLETLKGQSSLEDLTPRLAPCYLINYLAQEKERKLIVHQPSSLELFLEVKEGELS